MSIKGIYLLLGTNMGDRMANLQEATSYVSTLIGPVVRSSSVYQTSAWGKRDQADFLNQVLLTDTELAPGKLLEYVLNIERIMGRMRLEHWGERIIDIDILYYNDMHIDEEYLKIPHPFIQERAFTLIPLMEMTTDEMLHPVLRQNHRQMAGACSDTLPVRVYTP